MVSAFNTVLDPCPERVNRHSVVEDSKYCLAFRGDLSKRA